MEHGKGMGPKMGLSRSFALPVLRAVTFRGSCRAVTLPCFIRGSSFRISVTLPRRSRTRGFSNPFRGRFGRGWRRHLFLRPPRFSWLWPEVAAGRQARHQLDHRDAQFAQDRETLVAVL